ncbi:hypothetical protein H4Q26_002826 [Puccinia striiformis f. sp. tritici PST-130]|nr:hypothetical protein H4Q26_002826 [Puccinia striiformis f. sp. tritici PST-130]
MSLSPYLLWLGWLLLRVAAMTERPLLDSLKEDHPNLIYDHDILPHDTRGSWTNEHPSKKARHDFAGGAHALIDANNGGYPLNLIDHSLLDDFETQVILERTLGDLWNLPPLPAVDRDHRTRSSNYPLGGTQDGLEARQSRETAQVSDHSGSTSPSKESRTSPVTKPSSENDSRQASLTAPEANSPLGKGRDNAESNVMNSNESDLPSNATPALSHPPGQYESQSPPKQPGMKRGQDDIDPHVMDSSPPLPAVDRYHQSESINALGSTRDGDKAHQSRETAPVSDDSGGASPSKDHVLRPESNHPTKMICDSHTLPRQQRIFLPGKRYYTALSHPPGQSEPHSLPSNLKSKEVRMMEFEPQHQPGQPKITSQSPQTQPAPIPDDSYAQDDANLNRLIDPAQQSKERARSSSHHEDIGPFKKQRTLNSNQPSDDDIEEPSLTATGANHLLGKDQDDVEPHVTDSTELDLLSNAAPALSHPSRESEPQSHPEQPEMTRQSPERLEATQLAPSSDSSFVPDDAHLKGSIESSHQPNERVHLLSHYEDISPFKKQRTPAGDTGPSVETTSPADKDDGTIQSHPALMIDKGGKQHKVSYNQGTPETTSDLPQGKSSMASRMRKISLSPRQKNTILPTPDQMIALDLNREIMAPAMNIDEGMKEPTITTEIYREDRGSVDESPISLNHGTRGTSTIEIQQENLLGLRTRSASRKNQEPSTRLRRRIDRIAATLYETHFTDRFVKVMEERCKIFQWRVDQEHEAFMNSPSRKIVRTGDPSNEGSEGSRDSWITLPQKKSLSDIMESFRLLIRGSYYVMKVTLKGLYDMGVMRVPGENEYFDWLLAKTFNSLDGYKMLTQLGSETEEIPLLKQRAIEVNPFSGIFYKNGQPEVWRTIGNNDQEFWRFMKNQCKQFEERIERGKQISQELGPDRDILQLSGVKQILLDPPIRLTNLFKRYLLKKEYGFAYMERKPLYLIEKMYEIRKKTQHRVQETIPNEDLPFYMSRHWDLKRKTIRFNNGLILKYKPKSDTKSELVDKMQTILLPAIDFLKRYITQSFGQNYRQKATTACFAIGLQIDSPEMKIESYTDIQLLLIDHLVKQKNTKQLLTAGISLLAFWFREQKPQDWKRRFKADSGAFFKFVTEVVEQTY